MTRLIVAGVVLAPLAIIASCSSFSGDGPSTQATPDAATDAATAADAPETNDAALDAGDAYDARDAFDGCTPLFDDDFSGSELDPSWRVVGNTPTVGFNELILLKDGQTGGASAVWRAAPVPDGGTLRIQVELHITPIDDSTADGMAVVWAAPIKGDDAGTFLKIGGGSGALGVCPDTTHNALGPVGALGVGLYTYGNTASGFEPRHLALLDQTQSGNACHPDLVNPVTIPTNGVIPIAFEVAGAKLTGHELVDLPQTILSRDAPIGWVGFTAASGAFTSKQAIANVHVSSCQ